MKRKREERLSEQVEHKHAHKWRTDYLNFVLKVFAGLLDGIPGSEPQVPRLRQKGERHVLKNVNTHDQDTQTDSPTQQLSLRPPC